MFLVVSSDEMKNSETFTMEQKGVTSLELMEEAGTAIALEISKRYEKKKVLVICGLGNNGGDGFVIARKLLEKDFDVEVFAIKGTGSKEREKNKKQFSGKIHNKYPSDKYEVIIDAVIGLGLSRGIEKDLYETIIKINEADAYVVSVDIPSGINADNGLVSNIAVQADLTIALGFYKNGHFLNDGLDYSGELMVENFGIFPSVTKSSSILEEKEIKEFFPKRERNVHKGSFGKATIIAGSKELIGASAISFNALCALKMGSGYAQLAIPKSLYSNFALNALENTYFLLKDKNGNLLFDKKNLNRIISHSDAIAIGMGLGVSREVYKTIEYLLKNYSKTLIIDADGLNSLATYGVGILKTKKCEVIITPHIKEFARLSDKDVDEIKQKGIQAARDFAYTYDLTVILKSAVSIIASPTDTYINITGNSGLAKAGSGDVLSGILVGLASRSKETLKIAAVASYILGETAESAVGNFQNEYTLVASDIINTIPMVINKYI